jgi:hypothetical protein
MASNHRGFTRRFRRGVHGVDALRLQPADDLWIMYQFSDGRDCAVLFGCLYYLIHRAPDPHTEAGVLCRDYRHE